MSRTSNSKTSMYRGRRSAALQVKQAKIYFMRPKYLACEDFKLKKDAFTWGFRNKNNQTGLNITLMFLL